LAVISGVGGQGVKLSQGIGQRGDNFLLVVGVAGNMLLDDQAGVGLNTGVGVVGPLEPA
jgi:hypothetical protein